MQETHFITFQVVDDERYERVVSVTEALRIAKATGDWRDDGYWLGFFDDDARAHFWWPTEDALNDWRRRWDATPPARRFTDPSLKTPWTFGSMIDAFRNGDYELLGCEWVHDGVASLGYEPQAHPFGGSRCMIALIESFGHTVIAVPVD